MNSDGSILTEYYLRGLRVATSVIVVAITFGLTLMGLLSSLGVYERVWIEIASYAAFAAIAVTDAALTTMRRTWGRARWVVGAVVLWASLVAGLAVPADALMTPAHWTVGLTGWFGVLLFADRSLTVVVAFIGVHLASTAQLLVVSHADQQTIAHFTLVMIATCGFQIALAAAVRVLCHVAANASSAARQVHETRMREALAERLHRDRSRRYRSLRTTTVPLLRRLADGALSPADPRAQRLCAVEAARMRRLFADADDTPDPLTNELSAAVDVAERIGIIVTRADLDGWTQPPKHVRRILVDEAATALLGASTTARVTISEDVAGGVALSVVTDSTQQSDDASRERGQVEIHTIRHEEWTWVKAVWHESSTTAAAQLST